VIFLLYVEEHLLEALHYKPEVVSSVPDAGIGNFYYIILPAAFLSWDRIGLPHKQVSDDTFLAGKGSWCVGQTTLPLSCADYVEIWFHKTPRTLWGSKRTVKVSFILVSPV
jgi:hypothetical protein